MSDRIHLQKKESASPQKAPFYKILEYDPDRRINLVEVLYYLMFNGYGSRSLRKGRNKAEIAKVALKI